MDKGASLRDRATAASQSNPQAVSSIAGIPSAGDWIIIRAWSLQYREVTKVTAKLLKLGAGSTRYPTQMSIGDCNIVCAVPDRETAMALVNSIAGVDGECKRRERAARADFDARITKAKAARDAAVARLVAQAMSARQGQDPKGLGGDSPASAVAEGHAPEEEQP